MSEPLKCRCGAEWEGTGQYVSELWKITAWYHPTSDCFLSGRCLTTPQMIEAYNAFVSREADIIAGARAMLNKCYGEVQRHYGDGTELNRIADIDPAIVAKEVMEKKA